MQQQVKQFQVADINVNLDVATDIAAGLDEAADIAVNFPFEGTVRPPILYDGNTVGWYIADDLSTITYGVGNLVAQWDDFLESGRDLAQAVGADQPLWSANGVLFDGASEFMKVAGGFVYVEPQQIYMVINAVTHTANDYIYDGNANNDAVIFQSNPSPRIIGSPGFWVTNDNLTINTDHILRVLMNGASSFIRVDETAAANGNTGGTDLDGFTLAARADGNNGSNIQVKEVILRNIDDTAANEQIIYDYLADKYSI